MRRCAVAVGLSLTLLLIPGCAASPIPHPAPVATQAPAPAPPAQSRHALTVVPNGKGLLAIGSDSTYALMDASGRILHKEDLGSTVRGFIWSSGGRQVIIVTEDNRRWLAGETGAAEPLKLPDGPLYIAWSPDESRLLLGQGWPTTGASRACQVWFYTMKDGSLRELGQHDRLLSLDWQDDAHALVSLYAGGGHSRYERRSIDTWEQVPGGSEQRGTLSPDLRTLVVNPTKGAELTTVDLITGQSRTIWQDKPPGVSDPYTVTYSMDPGIFAPVLFTPDSSRFAYTVQLMQPPYLGILRVADRSGHDELVTDAQAGAMAWAPSGELVYGVRTDNGVDVMLGKAKLGEIPGGQRLGAIFGGRSGAAFWSPDQNQVVFAAERERGDARLVIAKRSPAKLWEVPNGDDLIPVAWVGDKVLVVESPYFHTPDSEGRRDQALWLVDPETGARTPAF